MTVTSSEPTDEQSKNKTPEINKKSCFFEFLTQTRHNNTKSIAGFSAEQLRKKIALNQIQKIFTQACCVDLAHYLHA
jgi:hypothetical protein